MVEIQSHFVDHPGHNLNRITAFEERGTKENNIEVIKS